MKLDSVDYNKLSPMMKQYYDIKKEHTDELLFFRLGDFYELFFEDGELASRELELTLTGKNAGLDERIPMCGVPFHSVKPYIEKLVNKGYKVAICEQLEDPRNVKGMVKRGVVNVVSKSTFVDLDFIASYDFNYLCSLIDTGFSYILTYADISIGKMYSKTINRKDEILINEILKLNIKEIIVDDNISSVLLSNIKEIYNIGINNYNDYSNFNSNIICNISDENTIKGINHLLNYLVKKGLKDVSHIKEVEMVFNEEYLNMDIHTIRNLELVETLRLKERNYSLLWLIDKCKTAMGSRCLKNWLLNPLINIERINDRYNKIEKLMEEFLLKEELRNNLNNVYDIERLTGKVNCGILNARDLLQLKNSLGVLPNIKRIISSLGFDYNINDFKELYELLDNSINEDAPVGLKDGYLIKEGYSEQLDDLKKIKTSGKDYISSLENEEKERTGIKTLKVGFNKVFGYFIEVSKGQVKLVSPEWHWERRQTLADKERYITPKLKEYESVVLNSEEKIIDLEYELFMNIKEKVKNSILDLQVLAQNIAAIDALSSLAVVAEVNNFVRPKITHEKNIEIYGGRHPVVEYVNKQNYVANDCLMPENINTLLITGPNMAGKSTYMRQLAVIVILAQMGSFVPCENATLPVFDKIFTRIGASDDLVSGKSTFMVEMTEAKNAICNATENSLILFDELGRGTATFDGMSLAKAILEYLNTNVKCKILFSTHYHELTALENELSNIKNVHVSAIEENDNITFLHKLKNGSVDKSYGISVASLAGLPESIIKRSKIILKHYETSNKKEIPSEQLSFNFEEKTNLLQEEIDKIDIMKITPIDAINILNKLKNMQK